MSVTGTILRVVAAISVGISGYIHYQMWETGYRAIPIIGSLFVFDVIASVFMAFALILTPARIVALAALGLELGAILGLAISNSFGLFGFRETGTGIAQYVLGAYASEGLAVLLLVAYLISQRGAPWILSSSRSIRAA